MSSVIYLLVIIHALSVSAAQGPGSSCHYRNGCTPPPDVCSVPLPACQTDWFGTYCQMHNIARAKPASQSSTWTDSTGTYDAGKAVDGDVNTDLDHGSCSHTNEPDGGNASWHVFLGGTFLISRITIYLRDDNIYHNQAVEVLVNNRTCRNLPVIDIRDSTDHLISNPVTLSCAQPIEGDTVTIVMAGPFLALCEVQVFGKKKESCHCSNDCLDFPNTACSTRSSGPVCKTPWFGSFCQMENIAFQKTATQSSTYNDSSRAYCAAYAVDGHTDTDFNNRSCSHTDGPASSSASWQVLLDDHRIFNISRVRIYLRDSLWDRNSGLQVLVNGSVCGPADRASPDWLYGPVANPVEVRCTSVMKGNNVTITISGQLLTLCEVQVFVCGDGWFGSDCNKQCQCLDPSEVCDKETGYCRSGCAAGKQGSGCQQVCNNGFFGSNCKKQCQCLHPSKVCDKETGYCRSGCAAGKQGPGCQQDCDHGHYGVSCSYTCGQCSGSSDCQKANGTCTQGCQQGYSPPFCKACRDGWFGDNCEKQCQCLNSSEVCHKETGYCRSGCVAGKHGPGCQQDCDQHFYGVNCSSTCGQCLNLSDCKKDDGTCSQGCQPGYRTLFCKDCVEGRYGVNCSQQCGSCKDGSSCNTTSGVCTHGCADNFEEPNCKYCVEGRHGVNCSQQCGSCKDGAPCNTTTGVCTQGCADNFVLPDCKLCSDEWFGTNCSQPCWCQNETEVCDKTTGTCTSGCRAGKTGVGCQDDCGQGQYGINCSSTCGQCSGSSNCKKDDGNCTQGCQTGYLLPLCKDCVEGRHGVNCEHHCGSCKDGTPCNTTTGVCTQGCADNFALPDCTLCSDEWFGTNCSQPCWCQNETEVCDKTTGTCTSGCRAGKTGVGCQDDCGQGQYGINCSSTCGQCSGSSNCKKDDGNCTQGCQTGYLLPLCKDCVEGRHGVNCEHHCGSCKDGTPCNTTTGVCTQGCADNFEEPNCTLCSDEWFGTNCSEPCWCQNTTEVCDKTIGTCTSGCRAGKTGVGCQDECVQGRYGTNCTSLCGNCKDGQMCNRTTGHCQNGCQVGYEKPFCSEESQTGNKQGGPQSLTGIIVGVVVGVLSVAVVVAVVVYIRRRRSLQKSHTEDQPEEDTAESSFSAVSSDRTASPSSKSAKPVKPSKKPRSPANQVYENSDTYYNVLPPPVPLDRLRQYVRQRVGGAGFEQEYKLLRHGLAKEHKEGEKPENKKRNRFLALFPYDESRVVLAPDGDATCDYIHASYVQGFHEANVFIAAQGPNTITVDDFWRMIWQEHVTQIIMLTRVMELNRKKCEQYWPDGTRDKKCGNIVIKPLLSTVRADFTIRKFLVQHSKTPSDKRTVTQLHFTSWPDHDVPAAPALVGFWRQYRNLASSEEDITGPVVVHCSAGVGRTGTFIALDNLFDEAESVNKVNVFACVSKLREARMNMVQTVEQYRFVHESVMEAIESRGTFYTLSDLEAKFGSGLKYSRQQDMEMNRQFQSLESMKLEIPDKLVSDAYLPENVSKNRNKNIVPVNRGRPFLSTPVAAHNDYINAVILPSATQPLGLIATQTPLKDTVVDFWRLVFDHDCFTIVCLEDEGGNQAIYPRKNESLNIGPFRLTTLKEDTSRDSFTEMELNLALREQDNTLHQIRVFKVRSQIPGPTEPMLEFVNEIGRKGSSEEHKTLVHCLDGARLCGVFCSVLNIISRLRLDKEVDIYLTIRELQCIRPQFIQSYDQYKFCYDLVKEYLRDNSMYANM